MADKPLPWFRAYPEAAFDPKFDIAARSTGIDDLAVFGAWWKILCIAGGSPVRGSLYVTAMKRYSNADVAAMLRLGNDQCNALLEQFIELDMLDTDEAGAYRVKNWDKRQFESDNSTKRVQEHRERAKKAGRNGDETLHARYSNVSVTPPDTDTDTDTDTEEEPAADPFTAILRVMEHVGITATGPDDVQAIQEIIKMGATLDDLTAGIEWKVAHNSGRTIRSPSQLVGPTKTAMVKRLQANGSSSPPREQTYAETW